MVVFLRCHTETVAQEFATYVLREKAHAVGTTAYLVVSADASPAYFTKEHGGSEILGDKYTDAKTMWSRSRIGKNSMLQARAQH